MSTSDVREVVAPPLPHPWHPVVSGTTAGGFEELRESFSRAVASQAGGGASFAVWKDGELVVDLVGGTASADSLFPLYSVTKSLTALACWHAHERSLIDIEAPLAGVWPEFARPSTRQITLLDALSHRSGLASFADPLDYEQLLDGADDEAIGRQEPFWEPQSAHGYHSFSLGTIARGVFRRVLGRTVGEYLREVLADVTDQVWIGAPAAVFPQVLPVEFLRPAVSAEQAEFRAASTIPRSGLGPLLGVADVVNDELAYAADWPAGSGLSNARALATIFGALRDGDILSAETVGLMTQSRAAGPDAVLGVASAYGGGVQLPSSILPMLSSASFGHEGAGGTLVLADERYGVACAWTTSVHPSVPGAAPEAHMLVGALRAVLDGGDSDGA